MTLLVAYITTDITDQINFTKINLYVVIYSRRAVEAASNYNNKEENSLIAPSRAQRMNAMKYTCIRKIK